MRGHGNNRVPRDVDLVDLNPLRRSDARQPRRHRRLQTERFVDDVIQVRELRRLGVRPVSPAIGTELVEIALQLAQDGGIFGQEVEGVGQGGGSGVARWYFSCQCILSCNGKKEGRTFEYLPATMRRRESSPNAASPGGADPSPSYLAFSSHDMISRGSWSLDVVFCFSLSWFEQ